MGETFCKLCNIIAINFKLFKIKHKVITQLTVQAQAGIKTARRNINNLRYADDTTFMAEGEEKLKSLLMKVKEESGKSWLKAQHSEN